MKGKTSFQLYTEWIELFEELSNEDAGELIKHIYKYVNDQNPTTENALVSVAFISIKQQLKRDLKKWKKRSLASSTNGTLGGRPIKPSETPRLRTKPSKPVKVKAKVKVEDKEKEKEKKEIIFPFDSQVFLESWKEWKEYKKVEHRFRFDSSISEQKSLSKLKRLSDSNEKQAIEILDEAMANGYVGFFALDKQTRQRTSRPSNIHRNKTKSKYNF